MRNTLTSVRHFAQNTILLFSGRIGGYFLFFLFTVYAARYLGAKNFGVFSFALVFTNLFGMLGDLGVRKVITRDIARNKSFSNQYIGKISSLRIVLVVIVFGATVFFINVLGYPKSTKIVVYIFALAMIFKSFTSMFYATFQAHEKMQYESLGLVIFSSLLLVGTFVVVNRGLKVRAFALLYLLSCIIVFIYCLASYTNLVSIPRPTIDWSFLKEKLKEALPFGLIGVSEMIYQWSDSLMLSMMKGDEVVGWYSVAYRLFHVTLLIPSVCGAVIFPIMSRYYVSSLDSLQFIHEKYFKYLATIGIFIGIGGTFLGDKIILLFWGNEYQPSIIAFQILIWSTVLIFINSSFVQLLESTNRQMVLTRICIASAIYNLCMNFILIPRYSYVGASIATVSSELLITVGVIAVAMKTNYKIEISTMMDVFFKLTISSLSVLLLIFYFGNSLSWPVIFIISPLLYFAVLYSIKGFDESDLVIIKGLLGR